MMPEMVGQFSSAQGRSEYASGATVFTALTPPHVIPTPQTAIPATRLQPLDCRINGRARGARSRRGKGGGGRDYWQAKGTAVERSLCSLHVEEGAHDNAAAAKDRRTGDLETRGMRWRRGIPV